MPYAPEHKQRSRQRIVRAASKMFRRDGYDQTSVDALMAEAGLTRGGFYAHFADKTELFESAIAAAFEEAIENLFSRGLGDLRGDDWLDAAEARYLREKHRRDPANGCALPSLASDVARAPQRVQQQFEQGLEAVVNRMLERCDGQMERREAYARLSRWVGAMLLARAVSHRRVQAALLEAARGSEAVCPKAE